MTTTHTIARSRDVEITLDSYMRLEVETWPQSVAGEFITVSDDIKGALDAATRILYAAWLYYPDTTEARMREHVDDIVNAYNRTHK